MKAKHVLLLLWAVLMQAVAVGCTMVTIVRGGYAGVLLAALAFTFLACALLILPFRRGGLVMKITCGVLALPTIFVVLDFLRRAPFVF